MLSPIWLRASVTEKNAESRLSIARLVFIPAVVTLAVTLLRLVGEQRHWSPLLFNPAWGGSAIIAIVWLPLIFGPFFALKLTGAGEGPRSKAKAVGFAVLGAAVFLAGLFLISGSHHQLKSPVKMLAGLFLFTAAAGLQLVAWPAFGKILLAYAYAARIPVAIVMLLAESGKWGTHYAGAPHGFPEMSFWPRYVQLALVPQLVFWVGFTVITGSLLGSVAGAIATAVRRPEPARS